MARDYHKQMLHKKKMKNRFARTWYFYGGYGSYENVEKHFTDYGKRCEYWKTYYLSGARGYAKLYTNKALRARYRSMKGHRDIEDCYLPAKSGSYRRYFDYHYTVW